jgi:hypothetical protein
MEKNIQSLGRFELKNGVSKVVEGMTTTYTFQLIGDGDAMLYGSLDDKHWTLIAEMSATTANPDSFVGQHTWRYLKAAITGTAVLYGNRG